MMKPLYWLAPLLALVTNCTTHKGWVDYEKTGVYSSDVAGNVKFKDVGPVATSARSFVWTSCDSVAQDAVRELLDMAKARGANTVYNIRFDSGNGLVTTPTCQKGWGWFAVYLVGGLGPWVTLSSVEGVAATIPQTAQQMNSIYIDSAENTGQLAANYIHSIQK